MFTHVKCNHHSLLPRKGAKLVIALVQFQQTDSIPVNRRTESGKAIWKTQIAVNVGPWGEHFFFVLCALCTRFSRTNSATLYQGINLTMATLTFIVQEKESPDCVEHFFFPPPDYLMVRT